MRRRAREARPTDVLGLGVSDVFDWQANRLLGEHAKVTPDPREHFTMTLAATYATVFGGNVGISVLYSAVLFAKRR